MSLFLQIHFLTSYPSALLNRDDVGFAKRIPFGGASRTRISSQCLKRHWRTFDGLHSLKLLGAPESFRSRITFDLHVRAELVKAGVPDDKARAATEALMLLVLGQSAKAKKKAEAESAEGLETSQVTVLGRPEITYLRSVVQRVIDEEPDAKKYGGALEKLLGKEGRENLKALRTAAGLDAALFGRMITADILARGDAAVHVAHAFTVHAEASESDYFSAIDDLVRQRDDESLGSGHIGNTELTSGLYYGYVVIDVPLLVSNLQACDRKEWRSADRELAARVVENFIHLVATVSPGAKLGSTAPYAYAHMIMVEAGEAQPRTLANAFLKPVKSQPDLVANTFADLANHLGKLDAVYGSVPRRTTGIGPMETLEGITAEEATLSGLAAWAAARVREG